MSYTVIPGLAARVNDLVADAPATGPIQGRALFTDDHAKTPVLMVLLGLRNARGALEATARIIPHSVNSSK